MEAEWPTFRVEELQAEGKLLVEDGNHGEYRPLPPEFGSGATAFIRAADMDNGRVRFESADRIIDTALARIRKGVGKGGDILFSHKGTVGKLALVPLDAPPFVCSPQTTFWRVLDPRTFDRRFLYAFMRSDAFIEQWRARKGETDMADYVSLTAQREFRVPVPGIKEQETIGRILGAIDDKIELNRSMNKTLHAMAEALFRSWFVDFDPVGAKVAGRRPFGMDLEIAELFPDRFVESAAGPIPAWWFHDSVYEVAEVIYGAPFSSRLFNRDARGLPLIRIRDLESHSPEVFTDEEHPKGTRIRPGDIVVGMDGEFRAHVWRGPESWLNQRVCHFRPRKDTPVGFVYLSIIEPLADIERGEVGTTVSHLGKADIDRFRILIPDGRVLDRFGAATRPLFERILANAAESHTLEALRDVLLPRLLSREIRVREAANVVERAGV